jgi:exonuclease III
MKNATRDGWERKTILSKVSRQLMVEKRDRSAQKPPGIDSTMLERPLMLASLNIRGLRGDTPKPKEIKAWMASLVDPPQILLLQEHHLCKEGVQRFGKKMELWNGIAHWNEGIPMGRSQRISVGTTILVDRATSPYIRDHGILVDGRAQYVTLLSPEGSSLTIINIYAQQTSNERAYIWGKITQGNFESDHILVGGDFNHLEEITRRGVPSTRQIHRREASAWHQMTLRYGLADAWELGSFRKMSKKSFTFDNGRSGRQAAVSRIDKFMVSQGIEERGGRVESADSIRKLSDHSPLTIKIWGTHPPTKKQTRFFDVTLLSEENGKAEMLQAWSGGTVRPSSGRDWAMWLEEAI